MGCSAILSDLAKKGVSGGRDEERMESMNVVPVTVVERKEKTMRVEVSDLSGWESVDERVSELVIASQCCNEVGVKEVDLERFVSLKVFEVGDECFENVEEVKLIVLNQLETVVIGQKCFTKKKNRWENNPDRHFYLKNCEQLRELKIGRDSFSDYSVCEIDSLPSLEVIEMGEANEWSNSGIFYHASLELKSDCD